MASLLWDVYCRVIDNLGDAGVCWRLAADLAGRGQRVRLFIDDAGPLGYMAPGGAAGVQVLPWPGPAGVGDKAGGTAADKAAGKAADTAGDTSGDEAGDVVIEAFGCELPETVVQKMLARPPVWINLEYLSAETYVERSHGLPSPQRNGLTKWFFYPGFTARTGGLLREPGLLAERARFDRDDWLAGQGITRQAGERIVTLFCYDNSGLPALLRDLAQGFAQDLGQNLAPELAPDLTHAVARDPAQNPTLLLLPPGPAQTQVNAAPPGVRLHCLPWLSQRDFDRLLWSSDLNFVRGEDSLVRALWAGAPFVWQAYPQHDGAHHAKVEALIDRLLLPPDAAALWRAWNDSARRWPGLPAHWEAAGADEIRALPDLVTQLMAFVEAHPQAQTRC